MKKSSRMTGFLIRFSSYTISWILMRPYFPSGSTPIDIKEVLFKTGFGLTMLYLVEKMWDHPKEVIPPKEDPYILAIMEELDAHRMKGDEHEEDVEDCDRILDA